MAPTRQSQQKVICVGNGAHAQARVAQACDRCRSKKIRCDGKLPRCSSCASIGFECKTSDKLSRRAFPRGYTESLEQRVIRLEAGKREVEAVLRAREAELEALRAICAGLPSSSIELARGVGAVFGTGNGNDNGAARAGNGWRACACSGDEPETPPTPAGASPRKRPRCVSEVFRAVQPMLREAMADWFKHWAPLYPFLDQSTLEAPCVKKDDDCGVNAGSAMEASQLKLQAILIYAITTNQSAQMPLRARQHAPSSSPARLQSHLAENSPLEVSALLEHAWPLLMSGTTLAALRCLLLAQMYSLLREDYFSALRWRGQGVSTMYGLGMHRHQPALSSPTAEETARERAFRCQYILDTIIAAVVGVPVLLRDDEIDCERFNDSCGAGSYTSACAVDAPPPIMGFTLLTQFARMLSKGLRTLDRFGSNGSTPMFWDAAELQSWRKSFPDWARCTATGDRQLPAATTLLEQSGSGGNATTATAVPTSGRPGTTGTVSADARLADGGAAASNDNDDGKQWTRLLSKIDSGRLNIFNGIYGGSEAGVVDEFGPQLKGLFG
ncbi:hypothetical protein KEM52_005374 [Ascosphaera acerosa]|nr:hypothetical protein KEM52_005374 [Ascosphaera acerosa]